MTLEHEWDKMSVDFPLTKDSVVLEIGGYKGRWALEIAQRYQPRLFVVEPQDWAFVECCRVLKEFPRTQVFNIALGKESGKFPMGNWETDGCSFTNLPGGKPVGIGEMIEFKEFMNLENIDHINLCLMNIEGYEFRLIPYMLQAGIMDKIDYFICQFHPTNDGEVNQYHDLRRVLKRKKKVRFDFGPILTCWEPK